MKRSARTKQVPRIVAASADHAPLKTAHFSLCNGSGMHAVAKTMVEAERKLGLDSHLINIEEDSEWEHVLDVDIHVSHTHVPVIYKGKAWKKQVTKPFKLVTLFHGTPEHMFENSVNAGEKGAYAPSNALMIMQRDLRVADARVTCWERHQAIYQTMVDKGTKVHLVPLGVNKEFWAAGASRGKYQGNPSVWYGENPHTIKWGLDLLLAWPWISSEVDEAYLHMCYLAMDLHRYFFPLVHANGSYYRAHIGAWTYPHEELRNIFKSVDFHCGLVRYGDFNRLSMEANAAGAKTISYKGNPYSWYHVSEGDQRTMAKEMIAILRGDVEPRADRLEVPDSREMAEAMIKIYEEIL